MKTARAALQNARLRPLVLKSLGFVVQKHVNYFAPLAEEEECLCQLEAELCRTGALINTGDKAKQGACLLRVRRSSYHHHCLFVSFSLELRR
jgi:hypothetical protein